MIPVSDPNSTVWDSTSAAVVHCTVILVVVIFEKVATEAKRGPARDDIRRIRLFSASAIYNVPPSLTVIPAGFLNVAAVTELFAAAFALPVVVVPARVFTNPNLLIF